MGDGICLLVVGRWVILFVIVDVSMVFFLMVRWVLLGGSIV